MQVLHRGSRVCRPNRKAGVSSLLHNSKHGYVIFRCGSNFTIEDLKDVTDITCSFPSLEPGTSNETHRSRIAPEQTLDLDAPRRCEEGLPLADASVERLHEATGPSGWGYAKHCLFFFFLGGGQAKGESGDKARHDSTGHFSCQVFFFVGVLICFHVGLDVHALHMNDYELFFFSQQWRPRLAVQSRRNGTDTYEKALGMSSRGLF